MSDLDFSKQHIEPSPGFDNDKPFSNRSVNDEPHGTVDGKVNWKLAFDSEFNSPDDLKKWNIQDQSGQNSNNELSAYVPDAFQIKDGLLHIRAEKRDATYGGKLMHYTSGLLNTNLKFDSEYGRFDIRLKVPEGKGFWPAFWMLPSSGDWPPEIDVLEVLGDNPQRMYFTNHWGPDHNGTHPSFGQHYDASPDFSQEFHVVSGVWDKDQIDYYVDGKEVASSHEGIPHEKMYMILNLAVGGDWPGSPDDKTKFPNDLQVDYVRVYKAQPNSTDESSRK